jgi:hypothetical protein
MFEIALPGKRLQEMFHLKYRELRFERACRTAKSNSNGVRSILLIRVLLNRKYIGQKFICPYFDENFVQIYSN